MRHIRTDVHQVGDAVATLALGITLEEFTDLEEKHHEDGLRILRLCSREETNTEGTNRGDGHKKVFVEGIAVDDTFPRLVKSLMAY